MSKHSPMLLSSFDDVLPNDKPEVTEWKVGEGVEMRSKRSDWPSPFAPEG